MQTQQLMWVSCSCSSVLLTGSRLTFNGVKNLYNVAKINNQNKSLNHKEPKKLSRRQRIKIQKHILAFSLMPRLSLIQSKM
jgi:hypothetical protein